MATIRDIAREAGVSVSTVSRVLSGKPDVAQETLARVQSVILARHFQVNRNAQYLKQADTATIVVVAKGLDNALFATMIELVQTAIAQTAYRTAIRYIDEDADEVATAERLVPEFKPKGFVFLGGDVEHFEAGARRVGVSTPAVVLTNQVRSPAHPLLSSVSTDDAASGHLAVHHLVAMGHRAIGVIGGNQETSTMSHHRMDGARAALDEAGLNLGGALAETRYSMADAYAGTTDLFRRCPDLTALYAMSDVMALGAIRALADLGRRVPDDVSVVGHDGIALGSFTVPRLTTIRQPQEQIVDHGLRLLLDDDARSQTITVPVELVPGESVRPPGRVPGES